MKFPSLRMLLPQLPREHWLVVDPDLATWNFDDVVIAARLRQRGEALHRRIILARSRERLMALADVHRAHLGADIELPDSEDLRRLMAWEANRIESGKESGVDYDRPLRYALMRAVEEATLDDKGVKAEHARHLSEWLSKHAGVSVKADTIASITCSTDRFNPLPTARLRETPLFRLVSAAWLYEVYDGRVPDMLLGADAARWLFPWPDTLEVSLGLSRRPAVAA